MTKQAPIPCVGSCALFAETNHTLRGVFLNYWQAYGGLPVYGFPLTEELQERNAGNGQTYTVQYFERNRFEYHPENRGTRYEVQLGRLGAEVLAAFSSEIQQWPVAATPNYGNIATAPPVTPAPTPTPAPQPSPTPPPASSAAAQFKSGMVNAINRTFPPLQNVLDVCPGANPLVCQSSYDTAARASAQLGDMFFTLAGTAPAQCGELFSRVNRLRIEGNKWFTAPYVNTRQGFIDRSEAINRAASAGQWFIEARRVIEQEPGACR